MILILLNLFMKKNNSLLSSFQQSFKTLAFKSLIFGVFLSLGIGLTIAALEVFSSDWKRGDKITPSALNDLASEVKSLRTETEELKKKTKYSNQIGETAWLGRITSINEKAGFGAYEDSGNSSLFKCENSKGYCTALRNGAFISSFKNTIDKSCYFYLRIGGKTISPYALSYGSSSARAVQTRGGSVLKDQKVGWFRNDDDSYDDNCSNSSQQAGFTLITIQ